MITVKSRSYNSSVAPSAARRRGDKSRRLVAGAELLTGWRWSDADRGGAEGVVGGARGAGLGDERASGRVGSRAGWIDTDFADLNQLH